MYVVWQTALVELALSDIVRDAKDSSREIPVALIVAFCVTTSLLISAHLLALMISTCILPHLDAIAMASSCALDQLEDGDACGAGATLGADWALLRAIRDSPHEKMHWYIEIAWFCSNGLGILLFFVSLALLVWIKMYPITIIGAVGSTAVIVPILLLLVFFGFHFYQRLISHKYEATAMDIRELYVLDYFLFLLDYFTTLLLDYSSSFEVFTLDCIFYFYTVH